MKEGNFGTRAATKIEAAMLAIMMVTYERHILPLGLRIGFVTEVGNAEVSVGLLSETKHRLHAGETGSSSN